MVSAPASGDRGPGFDPHRSRGNLVSEYLNLNSLLVTRQMTLFHQDILHEYASLCVICTCSSLTGQPSK